MGDWMTVNITGTMTEADAGKLRDHPGYGDGRDGGLTWTSH